MIVFAINETRLVYKRIQSTIYTGSFSVQMLHLRRVAVLFLKKVYDMTWQHFLDKNMYEEKASKLPTIMADAHVQITYNHIVFVLGKTKHWLL